MFEALRERDFRLLFTGQAISLIGSSVTTVALAFAVLEIGSRTDRLGIVVAAGLVPLVLFLLIGGVWADRLPRQWVMLVSDVVRFFCQAAMAWLLITHHATIWELVVLQFVRGTAEAFFRPAQTGLVPHTVSAGRLQQANALRGLTDSLGVTMGAALGGVLVAVMGSGWAIGVDASPTWQAPGFCGDCGGSFRRSPRGPALWRPPRAASRRGSAALPPPCRKATPAKRPAASCVICATAGRSSAHAPGCGSWSARRRCFTWSSSRRSFVLGPYVAKYSLGGAAAWGAILASFGVGQVIGGATGLRLQAGAAAAPVRLAHAARSAAVCLLCSRLRHGGADRRRGPVRHLGGARQRALGDHAPGTDPGRVAVARVGLRSHGFAGLLPAGRRRCRSDRRRHRRRRLVHRGERRDGRPRPCCRSRCPTSEASAAAARLPVAPQTGLPVSSHSR